ncbi:MAG: surface protein [Gemmatales bacterium]|nr:MAG: surface protein [Gemmatales bacterium]
MLAKTVVKCLIGTLSSIMMGSLVLASGADIPTSVSERAEILGTPTAIAVTPPTIKLIGPLAMQQVVVTGSYADGSVRDLTPFAGYQLEGEQAALLPGGFLLPKQDGQGTLVVTANNRSVRVPVVVSGMNKRQPVSFRNDVIAALNVGGCNQGACHGTPSGKNGFRLSLRGYDPADDYIQLSRDVQGRRTDRLDPDSSLILLKAWGAVPHEGGVRFKPDSIPSRFIRRWLAEGLQDDPPDHARLTELTVVPGARVLRYPASYQQLAVIARYSDGSTRDVTRLTVFSSSDSSVAEVSEHGLVEFQQAGEVAILVRYLEEMKTVRLTYLEPKDGFVWKDPPANNFVDTLTFAKLKMLNIQPSELCTDEEFIRRAYLDLCGILPTAEEVRKFLANKDSDKRAQLIDALLERPEYADFWTLKWCDVLRSSRKSIQVKGVHVYQQWLRNHLIANTRFDQIVTELLTASGSTFSNPPANYYRISRDPQTLAESTAQLFFGIRMQCAKCHNHPFERWTQDDYYSMAAFFARVKRKKDPLAPGGKGAPGSEIIYSDRSGEVVQPRSKKTMAPKIMGLPAPQIPEGVDRREVLARMVVSKENTCFAKSVVNRIWYHLIGRGIVEPVDDFRESNPPANDALLTALAEEFVKSNYDIKHIIRTIMNSRTYQLSAQTNRFNEKDEKYFSHAVTRLLTAEQLLDAICFATGVPEKFPGMPLGTRAVQLPDGEINHPFLKTFGQPGRELACECERESDSNLAQALQLINGPTVNNKMRAENNRIGQLLSQNRTDQQILTELYLNTLSRFPTEAETKAVLVHIKKQIESAAASDKPAARRKAWEDALWALINSKEFLFRH